MSKTVATPFIPHPAHRPMSPADAEVFDLAAEMLAHPHLAQAIRDAGGDTANFAHFSRKECGGRPIDPWASDNDHEAVVLALKRVAEGLKPTENASEGEK